MEFSTVCESAWKASELKGTSQMRVAGFQMICLEQIGQTYGRTGASTVFGLSTAKTSLRLGRLWAFLESPFLLSQAIWTESLT